MDRFTKIFKIPELRNKVLFVLAILIIYRVAATIPIPGISVEDLANVLSNNQFLNLVAAFTGGGLGIVMLGLGPYITASIVMQLLTMIFPQLEQLYKYEGEAGRQKFNQYSRLLTVPFAFIQGFAFIKLLQSPQGGQVIGQLDIGTWISSLIVIAAGSVFLMWLGELITEKNIGNGVSLLIFAGIVAGAPRSIGQAIAAYTPDQLVTYIAFILIAIVVIAGVVYLTEAQRNIPINYARRVRGNRMYGGVSTYLPMRVNNAGVMPIIFAISILLLPGLVASFLAAAENQTILNIGNWITNFLAPDRAPYSILYFLLVVVFTYFYTAVTFDPKSISENIQKQGGYVPGIRPGKPTADFLTHLLNRVTLVGAIFLGIIAILPQIVQGFTGVTAFAVGGTSILIVVSVVLELMKAFDAQISMYEY